MSDTTLKDAIDCLADGHSFWTVKAAKEVCQATGVKWDDELVCHFDNQNEANPTNDPKGLWLNVDGPVDGVNALTLSHYVREQLKLPVERDYSGRGFQAQGNARVIAKHFGL